MNTARLRSQSPRPLNVPPRTPRRRGSLGPRLTRSSAGRELPADHVIRLEDQVEEPGVIEALAQAQETRARRQDRRGGPRPPYPGDGGGRGAPPPPRRGHRGGRRVEGGGGDG